MCIYGIYVGQDLVYVGKTTRDLRKRYLEHKRHIEQMNKGTYDGTQYDLYFALAEAMSNGKSVRIEPILTMNDIMTEKEINGIDLQIMELALISYLKKNNKLLNQEGVSKPYKIR